MKDQVQILTGKGITAVNSGDTEQEETERIKCGDYHVIVFSPESLLHMQHRVEGHAKISYLPGEVGCIFDR